MPSAVLVGLFISVGSKMRYLFEKCRRGFNVALGPRVVSLMLAVFVMAPVTSDVRAQVMGPALERHALEFGFIYKWYERDFESMYVGQEDWSAGALYFKYGVCRWATLSVEGGISTVHHDDFPDNDYRRYTIGTGLTALFYKRSGFRVEMAGHYSEIFDHDRSDNQFHKNTRDIVVAIQFEGFREIRDHEIGFWIGPAYVYDQVREYPWRTYEPVKGDTSNNLGVIVGTNVLLFDRINVFFNGVYADAFQPRVGAGVQF